MQIAEICIHAAKTGRSDKINWNTERIVRSRVTPTLTRTQLLRLRLSRHQINSGQERRFSGVQISTTNTKSKCQSLRTTFSTLTSTHGSADP